MNECNIRSLDWNQRRSFRMQRMPDFNCIRTFLHDRIAWVNMHNLCWNYAQLRLFAIVKKWLPTFPYVLRLTVGFTVVFSVSCFFFVFSFTYHCGIKFSVTCNVEFIQLSAYDYLLPVAEKERWNDAAFWSNENKDQPQAFVNWIRTAEVTTTHDPSTDEWLASLKPCLSNN